jgi:hypothetical protein
LELGVGVGSGRVGSWSLRTRIGASNGQTRDAHRKERTDPPDPLDLPSIRMIPRHPSSEPKARAMEGSSDAGSDKRAG